jgi:hypothetical protein
MGSYSIQSIIDEVEATLEDEENERYTPDNMLAYYNRAIEAVCRIKPDAYTVRENVTLVSGTVQSLPARRHRLIRPVRNMGGTGDNPGPSIRLVEFDSLNDFNPGWHTEDNSTSVDDVLYDESHPLEFWVSPPAPGNQIELIMAALPDAAEEADGTISILDIYRTPLIYFMVGYAHQSNRSDVDLNRGKEFIGMAMAELGVQMQGEAKK